jgi:hypothetical protein
MSRLPSKRQHPVAPFAAVLLVVLGMFLPATGGARLARLPTLPARAASLASLAGATRAAETALRRHTSHLAVARPLVGTAAAAGRAPRGVPAGLLPGVRAPPAPVA